MILLASEGQYRSKILRKTEKMIDNGRAHSNQRNKNVSCSVERTSDFQELILQSRLGY